MGRLPRRRRQKDVRNCTNQCNEIETKYALHLQRRTRMRQSDQKRCNEIEMKYGGSLLRPRAYDDKMMYATAKINATKLKRNTPHICNTAAENGQSDQNAATKLKRNTAETRDAPSPTTPNNFFAAAKFNAAKLKRNTPYSCNTMQRNCAVGV